MTGKKLKKTGVKIIDLTLSERKKEERKRKRKELDEAARKYELYLNELQTIEWKKAQNAQIGLNILKMFNEYHYNDLLYYYNNLQKDEWRNYFTKHVLFEFKTHIEVDDNYVPSWMPDGLIRKLNRRVHNKQEDEDEEGILTIGHYVPWVKDKRRAKYHRKLSVRDYLKRELLFPAGKKHGWADPFQHHSKKYWISNAPITSLEFIGKGNYIVAQIPINYFHHNPRWVTRFYRAKAYFLKTEKSLQNAKMNEKKLKK